MKASFERKNGVLTLVVEPEKDDMILFEEFITVEQRVINKNHLKCISINPLKSASNEGLQKIEFQWLEYLDKHILLTYGFEHTEQVRAPEGCNRPTLKVFRRGNLALIGDGKYRAFYVPGMDLKNAIYFNDRNAIYEKNGNELSRVGVINTVSELLPLIREYCNKLTPPPPRKSETNA